MLVGCHQGISAGICMGFIGLTGGRFKSAQDGSRLFFPWHSRGSGYVITSEQDDERLRRQIKVYEIVTLILIAAVPLIFVADAFKNPNVTIAAVIVVWLLERILFAAWMQRWLPRLKVTDEKLPRPIWSAWLEKLKPIAPSTVPEPSVTPVSIGGSVSAMSPKEIYSLVIERAKHGALMERCGRIVYYIAIWVGFVWCILPFPAMFVPSEYITVTALGAALAPFLLAWAILAWLKRRLLTDEEMPRQSLSAWLKDSSQ
jgi:hypothetical protein